MNTKFKRKSSSTERRISKSSEDRLNSKNQVQERMLKPLNKPWETNSITREDRCKPFILILKKEVQPLNPQSLTIWEEKSLNGKFGTITLRSSRDRRKRTKSKRTKNTTITTTRRPLQQKNHRVEDTLFPSRGAWKSCNEWFARTNKTKSTTNIVITGKRVKSKEALKESCYLFGVWITRRRRNTSLLFAGTPNTRICLPYLWEVTISPSRRRVKYWFGHWRTSLTPNTSTRASPPASCV